MEKKLKFVSFFLNIQFIIFKNKRVCKYFRVKR